MQGQLPITGIPIVDPEGIWRAWSACSQVMSALRDRHSMMLWD
jgi:hypothetical protein